MTRLVTEYDLIDPSNVRYNSRCDHDVADSGDLSLSREQQPNSTAMTGFQHICAEKVLKVRLFAAAF